jgi:hypothetical protein
LPTPSLFFSHWQRSIRPLVFSPWTVHQLILWYIHTLLCKDLGKKKRKQTLLGSDPQTTAKEWRFPSDLLSNNELHQRNGVFCAIRAETILRGVVAITRETLELLHWRSAGSYFETATNLGVRIVESWDGSLMSRKSVVNVSTEAEDISEDTADGEELVRAVVNCRVCELAMAS